MIMAINSKTPNVEVEYDPFKGNLWVPLVRIGEMRIQLPVRRMKLLAASDYEVIGVMMANEVYKSEYGGEDRMIVTLSQDGITIVPNPQAVDPPMMNEII